MAKTVKFNMRFGDTSIRTLDDLRENFSIEDVLAHFDNGLLLKFLVRRDYTEHAEKVAALVEQKPETDVAAQEIVSIFGIDMDENDVSEYTEMLRLRKKNEKEYAVYAQGKLNLKKSIKEYFGNYDDIVNLMMDHQNNLGKIKGLTRELLDTYMPVLKKGWRELYFTLSDNDALYPICHMLTQEFFRLHWLTENEQGKESIDTRNIYTHLAAAINKEIKNFENENENEENENGEEDGDEYPWIKRSNKVDATFWEDIEAAGRKYMILGVPFGAKVREPGNIKNEMDNSLNSKFIILNGIQYRHNTKSDYLYYAEV